MPIYFRLPPLLLRIFLVIWIFIQKSSPNHKYISGNRIWDDTLFWNYFMRLLLRSIVLDNSAHLQYWQILSKIVAGVNSHKKLRKSQYHSESVILLINNGLGSVTLSQIQINKPEFEHLMRKIKLVIYPAGVYNNTRKIPWWGIWRRMFHAYRKWICIQKEA